MTTLRCPECATSNARQRVRCRACGAILRRWSVSVAEPKEEAASAPPPSKRKEDPRLVVDLRVRRLREMEEEAKRRLHRWEKRLMEREVALDRREAAQAGSGTRAGKSEDSEPKRARLATPLLWRAVEGFGRPISRVETHISGLDGALRGGVPRGSVVVIAGAPGTMKTSLGLFILASNAISDLRGGLYVTFGQGAASVLRQMETLGIDMSRT